MHDRLTRLGAVIRVRRPGGEPSLVTQFAIISLVLLSVLGVGLDVQLHHMIETRARSEAERMGIVATQLVLTVMAQQTPTTSGRTSGTVSPATALAGFAGQLKAIAASLQGPQLRAEVLAANAWLADGTLVFSSRPELIGPRVELGEGARKAFQGQPSSRVATQSQAGDGLTTPGHGSVLEIFVPVGATATTPATAVVEMELPYEPVEAAITKDTRTMTAMLVIVLSVLWLVLFRLVSTASRRLRQHAEENRRLAFHDTLTGLPNRMLLQDRARQALAAAGRTAGATAILALDLDRFKEVNDTLGHHYGDGLLQGVAGRLQEVLRETDTASRLGGDEFAVLAVNLSGPDEAYQVAARVQAALHQPFVVDDVTLDVEASVGVAISPSHGMDVDTLLRCADVAMYTAKASRSGIEGYDPVQDQHTPERLALLGDLRRALEDADQLALHYQPKVSIDTAGLVGVEALLRWTHPVRGPISPNECIPVAEGTGLIHPLTTHTLTVALRQVRSWMDQGHRLPVAVNVSTRCLLDLGLPVRIATMLDEHGVPAELLRLEITESTLMADPSRALIVLSQLADLGVRLSIDDFGTGFSSMSHLKRLPVDELKVDRSFVQDMTTQPADHVLVRSVVELGHNLGLHVVAEGVETAETLVALAELGCDIAQGYFTGRPMPASGIDGLLNAGSPAEVPGKVAGRA